MKKKVLLQLILTILCLQHGLSKTNLLIDYSETGLITTEGSALCEDLYLLFLLPDTLKTGYTYESKTTINTDSRTLSVLYTLKSISVTGSILDEITQIKTDLNNDFESVNLGMTENSWRVNYNFQIDNWTSPTFNSWITPFNACYQISNNCDKIVVERHEYTGITYCGSLPDYDLEFFIENDTILLKETQTYTLTVCIEYNVPVRIDRFEISDFEPLNYEVYLKKESIFEPEPPSPNLYTYLSNVDQSACIIDGIDNPNFLKNRIYPNPASSFLTIENHTGQILLINQYGKEFKLSGNETYYVDHLAKGLYIVSYEINGKTIQESIIIE